MSDRAQATTIGFRGFAMLTGNVDARARNR
jgi:hypothetical protein